jgi:hypothetical protein
MLKINRDFPEQHSLIGLCSEDKVFFCTVWTKLLNIIYMDLMPWRINITYQIRSNVAVCLTWGCASKWHIDMMQRSESKILRMITNAPWYVSNQTIHVDLHVPFIKDVIQEKSIKHHAKLGHHSNAILQPLCCPDRLWVPPNRLYNVYRELFPGGKAAGAWSWPLTSNSCRGQENVDLYIHSPIRLHGVVLN